MSYQNDLNRKLYDKVQCELNRFHQETIIKSPREIYENAYQIIFKTDLVNCFPYCSFSVKTAKEMLKAPNLLDELYQEWLSNDYSYMQELQDTIDDFGRKITPHERITQDKER